MQYKIKVNYQIETYTYVLYVKEDYCHTYEL